MTDDRNVNPTRETQDADRAQAAAQNSDQYRTDNDEAAAAKQAQVAADFARGQRAFSGGQYRLAIAALESAAAEATPQTRLSGEIQMLLVSSYEGAGDRISAQTLCRVLTKHSDREIRGQAKGLLYVLEAPILKTKPEWVVEIPDLSETEDGKNNYRWGSGSVKRKEPEPEPWIPDPVDPTQVALPDNRFAWLALGGIALAALSLLWLA